MHAWEKENPKPEPWLLMPSKGEGFPVITSWKGQLTLTSGFTCSINGSVPAGTGALPFASLGGRGIF